MMRQAAATIVVVDDDNDVRDSLRILLESFGYSVRTHGNGADCLGDPHLSDAGCAILDVNLPGMSGLEIAADVNAGEKVHRRAGVKMHQG